MSSNRMPLCPRRCKPYRLILSFPCCNSNLVQSMIGWTKLRSPRASSSSIQWLEVVTLTTQQNCQSDLDYPCSDLTRLDNMSEWTYILYRCKAMTRRSCGCTEQSKRLLSPKRRAWRRASCSVNCSGLNPCLCLTRAQCPPSDHAFTNYGSTTSIGAGASFIELMKMPSSF